MQAMVLHQPAPVDRRPLVAREIPDPEPGDDEIVVRIRTCGVCRTDLHVAEGDLPLRAERLVPGHQIVGTVAAAGSSARRFSIGDRVGISWLHQTCGACTFCNEEPSRENLCNSAVFTGWTVDGGYAEFAKAPEEFAYRIPDGFSDVEAAPLLCGGIIGYRALRMSGIRRGQRLGLYGFGSAAHMAIQVARHWGCEVYVFTRSESNRRLARKLGAAWAGGAEDAGTDTPKLHASIIFAPAGPLVLSALAQAESGAAVVLAGIYMSEIPAMDYTRHLYDEKMLRSVANATRADGDEFLAVAAEIPIQTAVETFALTQANEALLALKTGRLCGSAVLVCGT